MPSALSARQAACVPLALVSNVSHALNSGIAK